MDAKHPQPTLPFQIVRGTVLAVLLLNDGSLSVPVVGGDAVEVGDRAGDAIGVRARAEQKRLVAKGVGAGFDRRFAGQWIGIENRECPGSDFIPVALQRAVRAGAHDKGGKRLAEGTFLQNATATSRNVRRSSVWSNEVAGEEYDPGFLRAGIGRCEVLEISPHDMRQRRLGRRPTERGYQEQGQTSRIGQMF